MTVTPRLTGDDRAALAATMRSAYEGGATVGQIAKEHGRSYGGVHRLLGEAGATMRQRGGARRAKVDA